MVLTWTAPTDQMVVRLGGSLSSTYGGGTQTREYTIYHEDYTLPEPTELPSASPSAPPPPTTVATEPDTTAASDDGNGDGAPAGAWTAADVARMTTDGDGESCYYALFAGERCTTAGAVYKITTNWCE